MIDPDNYDYVFESPEHDILIDAADPTRASEARYINHANPNSLKCNSQFVLCGKRVLVVSTRRIRFGEEIRLDYGAGYWTYRHRHATKCAYRHHHYGQ